jgi:hypothetical protein
MARAHFWLTRMCGYYCQGVSRGVRLGDVNLCCMISLFTGRSPCTLLVSTVDFASLRMFRRKRMVDAGRYFSISSNHNTYASDGYSKGTTVCAWYLTFTPRSEWIIGHRVIHIINADSASYVECMPMVITIHFL